MWYGKTTPEGDDAVFVAANLDPFGRHAARVDVPLEALGLPADATYRMRELLTDVAYEWHGPRGYVDLDPASAPAQIFALERMP
jgi:starch synthase (maltosyl-transferring)